MQVLEVGNSVFLLEFLPDNRRLVVATHDGNRNVTFEVRSMPNGRRVALHVPKAMLDVWWYDASYGHAIAVHPGGEVCYVAWAGRLYGFRTADGTSLPVKGVRANQVALSPDGGHLVAADRAGSGSRLFGVTIGTEGGRVRWRKAARPEFAQLAGFLTGGDRFVVIDDVIRVHSFQTGDELTAGRREPVGSYQPRVSPDGRHVAALGAGGLYLWELTALDKPRKIQGSSNYGCFGSFAFHPDGQKVAVIHGAPTLVKVYDVGSLKRVQTWKWKLGALSCVAFSPDGTLGAAGSMDGRIVVWDVDA